MQECFQSCAGRRINRWRWTPKQKHGWQISGRESGFSEKPRRPKFHVTANSRFRQQTIRQAKWKQRNAKCRTATAASVFTKEVPHMEWSGNSFKPCSPKPLPTLQISAEILHRSHTQFGISQPPASVSNPVKLSAFADSCCQTCTAGKKFLNQLKYPSNSLSFLNIVIFKCSVGICPIKGQLYHEAF